MLVGKSLNHTNNVMRHVTVVKAESLITVLYTVLSTLILFQQENTHTVNKLSRTVISGYTTTKITNTILSKSVKVG